MRARLAVPLHSAASGLLTPKPPRRRLQTRSASRASGGARKVPLSPLFRRTLHHSAVGRVGLLVALRKGRRTLSSAPAHWDCSNARGQSMRARQARRVLRRRGRLRLLPARRPQRRQARPAPPTGQLPTATLGQTCRARAGRTVQQALMFPANSTLCLDASAFAGRRDCTCSCVGRGVSRCQDTGTYAAAHDTACPHRG